MSRLLFCALLAMPLTGFAADPPLVKLPNPFGAPKSVEPRSAATYFLWYDKDGWHLRTISKGGQHRYNATIKVIGGTVAKYTPYMAEKNTARSGDKFEASKDRVYLTVELKTGGHIDGVDFQVDAKAKEIEFTLLYDADAKPDAINIGPKAEHPDKTRFTYPARPKPPK